ncbi:transglutaminase family protein [Rhodovulum sp.]|uniref:transglutaminase family protein n=1 Tax=Rhodovulum sp. TaxID=34009 RepID=UPI0017D61100|nr:transglutaminase family protein [Rhodovulum sp.]HDR27502.1 transglutaminase family protein [Rhodovulum sp.]
MTLVTITHSTAYRYAGRVALGPHRLMLRPRETPGLWLISFDMDVSPAADIVWSHAVAGNSVASASFTSASDMLAVRSRTTVELTAPAWPVFAIAASAASYPFLYASDDRIDLGALAVPQYADAAGRLSSWVEEFVMNRPPDTPSLLKELGNGVATGMSYQSRETEGTQGPIETLDRGWGSCRDFAVLLAEAARTVGFGAQLVSGWLHDPSGSRLGSAETGSTHAWVEAFIPGAGWIPFEPNNRAVGAANLIPVAVARHIAQVTPVAGSFLGTNIDLLSMEVIVKVADATASCDPGPDHGGSASAALGGPCTSISPSPAAPPRR